MPVSVRSSSAAFGSWTGPTILHQKLAAVTSTGPRSDPEFARQAVGAKGGWQNLMGRIAQPARVAFFALSSHTTFFLYIVAWRSQLNYELAEKATAARLSLRSIQN